MDPHRVAITQHAWDRFRERWCEAERPACWMRELRRLLQASHPEDLGHGKVLRLMTHGYQPASYYTVEGWRFVLNEEGTLLLTCEWAYKKSVKAWGANPDRRKRIRR